MKNEVLAVSGLSCAGKSTILMNLNKAVSPMGKPLEVMTSDVTRKLRTPDELFRRHVSEEEHAQRTANGEYIQSIVYGANHYSVRKVDVDCALSQGHHVLVDCVLEGVEQFKQHYSVNAVFVYASPTALYQRHLKRGTIREEMRWRLQNAAVELETALASGMYDLFINNADLAQSEQKIMEFLDGKHVASDPIKLDEFLSELRNILEIIE